MLPSSPLSSHHHNHYYHLPAKFCHYVDYTKKEKLHITQPRFHCRFSQSLQGNHGIVLQSDHKCFLQNPFQFTTYRSSYFSILQSLNSDSITNPQKEIACIKYWFNSVVIDMWHICLAWYIVNLITAHEYYSRYNKM
jgi:hypothetical protein